MVSETGMRWWRVTYAVALAGGGMMSTWMEVRADSADAAVARARRFNADDARRAGRQAGYFNEAEATPVTTERGTDMESSNWDSLGREVRVVVGRDGEDWRWKVTIGDHAGPSRRATTEAAAWRAAARDLLTRVRAAGEAVPA